ncbi:MAG: hypothetical protein ACRBK7_08960 [Acidimicrobiales bacterium]
MTWIYIAATIFGGAFLIPMVLGGLSSDLEGGFGGDIDSDLGDADFGAELGSGLDVDADLSGGLESGGIDLDGTAADGGGLFDSEAIGSIFSSLISFRTLVFFSGFFGAAGLVFGGLGYQPAVTFGTAVLIGTIAAVANSMLFGLIKNSQPNSQISDRTLEGRPATVVLPMQGSQRGRIRVELTGQPQYIVARPIEGAPGEPEQRFDVGASVVVVKIEDGTAHVASLAELDLGEES